MKRQDVSGQNTLHTDAVVSGGSAVDLVGINGTAPSVNVGTPSAGTLRTIEASASTTAVTSVAASGSNVTLLASNANRMGFAVFNDSSVNLFLKCGATASTSSFTVKMAAGSYYEVPFKYSGIVDGIWDSATGNARITEYSA